MSTINLETPKRDIWRKIKQIQYKNYRKPIAGIDYINTTIRDHEVIARHFSAISNNSDYIDECLQHETQTENMTELSLLLKHDHPLNDSITLDAFRLGLGTVHPSSPGPDGLT